MLGRQPSKRQLDTNLREISNNYNGTPNEGYERLDHFLNSQQARTEAHKQRWELVLHQFKKS